MSATLLQIVNRVRREIGWEDASAVSDRVSVVITSLVASAQREVLETGEWDFDIRSNGVLTTIAPYGYTVLGENNISNGSSTFAAVGQTDYATVTVGASRSRLAITTDASFGQTFFIINTASHPGISDAYVLETAWPGTTVGLTDTATSRIVTAEYVLPTTVRDVLSVSVEEQDLAVQFVDKATTFDQCVPAPFSDESNAPEVCFVGGSTTPTVTTGTTPTPGLGLWLYPVPSAAYVVRYTYRYRHPELSAATDTLQVPDHVIDDIVDLAVARAFRSTLAHDPEMAAQREIAAQARLRRKRQMTSAQPAARRSLRSHDRSARGPRIGSEPRNPREFV